MVIRSETTITAFRQVSPITEAENSTTNLLCAMVKSLPKGAVLDMIVGTVPMYQALKSCADIVSHEWDVDQYCHHEGWKEVMTVWKDPQIQATIREFDEEGLDSGNGPFSGLALREAIQAVRDGMHDRDSQEGGQ
jgi:hypothetical protein